MFFFFTSTLLCLTRYHDTLSDWHILFVYLFLSPFNGISNLQKRSLMLCYYVVAANSLNVRQTDVLVSAMHLKNCKKKKVLFHRRGNVYRVQIPISDWGIPKILKCIRAVECWLSRDKNHGRVSCSRVYQSNCNSS